MGRSVLLAKLIGPPFLAVGLGLLLNQETYWEMTDEVIRDPSPLSNVLIYLSGLLSMVVGVAVVNAHPSWTRDWRALVKGAPALPDRLGPSVIGELPMRRAWEHERAALANRPPLQRNALGQRLRLVLAQDRGGNHREASVAGHRLRQLRDGGRF